MTYLIMHLPHYYLEAPLHHNHHNHRYYSSWQFDSQHQLHGVDSILRQKIERKRQRRNKKANSEKHVIMIIIMIIIFIQDKKNFVKDERIMII